MHEDLGWKTQFFKFKQNNTKLHVASFFSFFKKLG